MTLIFEAFISFVETAMSSATIRPRTFSENVQGKQI